MNQRKAVHTTVECKTYRFLTDNVGMLATSKGKIIDKLVEYYLADEVVIEDRILVRAAEIILRNKMEKE